MRERKRERERGQEEKRVTWERECYETESVKGRKRRRECEEKGENSIEINREKA